MWAGSVSWVCTKVEGPALELLIERDLRDMVEGSMLQQHAGLWWAVKTSGRLKTTDVCIYECIGCICVCVKACAGASAFVLAQHLPLCSVARLHLLQVLRIFMQEVRYCAVMPACCSENEDRSFF